MGFDLDYIPIPHGAEPPMFIYETDEEFQQQLEIHRHAIHIRTLYAIKYAYDTKFKGDITIAFLNDQDTLLQCSPHEWVKNLKSLVHKTKKSHRPYLLSLYVRLHSIDVRFSKD